MRRWDEIKRDFQEEYDALGERPQADIVYFGYRDGKSEEFPSRKEAEKYTRLVEPSVKNKKEIDAYDTAWRAVEAKASERFHQELRKEYGFLSDEVYGLCYSRAYEDGHSAGYDEVANCMIGEVEFAEKLIDAIKSLYDIDRSMRP